LRDRWFVDANLLEHIPIQGLGPFHPLTWRPAEMLCSIAPCALDPHLGSSHSDALRWLAWLQRAFVAGAAGAASSGSTTKPLRHAASGAGRVSAANPQPRAAVESPAKMLRR